MTHTYTLTMTWTGNEGEGTKDYKAYSRAHTLFIEGKPLLEGSADPAFRGDQTKWNPEDLLLASLSSCHMLWYLHLCAVNGVVVEKYEDKPEAVMVLEASGKGKFTEATLKPSISLKEGFDEKTRQLALDLHHKAHDHCFIANSVNFDVKSEPQIM